MKYSFSTTIGDDVEIDVIGDYDKPDKSVGYSGSFWVEQVFLKNDNVDIFSILSDKQIEKLEYAALDRVASLEFERKQEAAEMRYERERDERIMAKHD